MTMANPNSLRDAAGAALLAVMFLSCARQAPTAESATAPASDQAPAPSPDAAPAAPPNEPSTTPPPPDPPTASNEPDLSSMPLARPSAKMSVAADVRYQIDGPIAPGQSATLHLAVVPRIARAPMQVSLTDTAGLTVAAGPTSVQKLGSRDVYRQQYSVTRAAAS